MPLISVTRLRVSFWRYLPAFAIEALRSARQAKLATGNLAVSIMHEAQNAFWTRTLWEHTEAMRAFMISGAHYAVMPRLLEWCNEASAVHWLEERPGLPSWPEAHRRMQQEGRRSKVNQSSEAHRVYAIPSPDLKSKRELRLK